ncbi:hypothetical protein DB347_20425 [Opitutaceae bacterium EW11]|nr:hypothetical protein DB347_20425 [Opitutaceae bacterium EW11]
MHFSSHSTVRFLKAAVLFVSAALGQATFALSPGDVVIVGRTNNTSPDAFAIVPLVDLPSGTTIYFTDNGWTGAQFRGASATDGNGNEDLTKFTALSTIPAGTIIRTGTTSASYAWTTSGTIPGVSTAYAMLALATAGDQIYAFEGPTNNPLLSPTTHLFVLDDTNQFENATSSNSGGIPPGLSQGTTAVTVNAATGGTISVNPNLLSASNDRAGWLAVFGNPANWVTQAGSLPAGSITVSQGGLPLVSISAPDSTAAEAALDPATYRIERTGDMSAGLSVNFSVGGTASLASDYTLSTASPVVIPAGASFIDVTLTPIDDAEIEGDETATITLQSGAGYTPGATPAASITLVDDDAPDSGVTLIHQIQGSTDTSPMAGSAVTIEAVVTGVFPGMGGFFVQEEDSDADSNPETSEGLFVYSNLGASLTTGDLVRVSGTVTEYNGLTELSPVASVSKLGTAPLPAASSVALPQASSLAFERFEGMRVAFPQTLYVTDTSGLFQYGEIAVSAGGLLATPTNVVAPGAAANALQASNNLNQLVIDDSTNAAYPDPTPHLFGAENTLRLGDTVTNAEGILSYQFGSYALRSANPLAFVRANPRPAPPNFGRTLRIVSSNVLNYFNGDGMGGGFPTSRGADTAAEFARQRAHILSALTQLNADIIGLLELENDGFGPTSAIQDLVNGLNAAAPAGVTYSPIVVPAPIGTDLITCGYIYRKNTVQPVGAAAVNMSNVFDRPPIAQTWRAANGELFTTVINHFKSKLPSGATGADTDQGDGQGAWNARRVRQAAALTAWLATKPTGSSDPDVLIIGDLNSYAMEDPVTAIRDAGYVDLMRTFEGVGGYSYAYDGQVGHLDHALASDSFYRQVVGADTWHNNAAEPDLLDYNLEKKSAAQQTLNSGTTPWRASDHDPVVIGFKPGRPLR